MIMRIEVNLRIFLEYFEISLSIHIELFKKTLNVKLEFCQTELLGWSTYPALVGTSQYECL